jgi:hypothetical protein
MLTSTLDELCDFIGTEPGAFRNSSILAPTNAFVDLINEKLLNKMTDEPEIEYLSTDIADYDMSLFLYLTIYAYQCVLYFSLADHFRITQEILFAQKPSGFPLSRLLLKVGAPVILLRNLNQAEGMCNGTRGTIVRLANHCIDMQIETLNFIKFGAHMKLKFMFLFLAAPDEAKLSRYPKSL